MSISRWFHIRDPGLRVSHSFRWRFHQSSQLRLSSTFTRPATRKPWVQRLPTQIQPYLYLMRVDKPIGTLLLFYPCGQSLFLSPFPKLVRSDSPTPQHGPLLWHLMQCNRRWLLHWHILVFSVLEHLLCGVLVVLSMICGIENWTRLLVRTPFFSFFLFFFFCTMLI